MTPLIQKLKALQNQFHDLSDYKFSTATIRLIPLIIQTLEAQEKENYSASEEVEQLTHQTHDQRIEITHLKADLAQKDKLIARQEKLLEEAKRLFNIISNDLDYSDPHSRRGLITGYLAALDEEGKK